MTLALAVLAALAAPQEDREIVRKVYADVRPSFAALEITLREKSRLEKAELEASSPDIESRQIQMLAENRQVFETWAVCVGEGRLLMGDRGLRPSDIERIEAVDAGGNRAEATIVGVGKEHDFVELKVEALPRLKPLKFSKWKKPETGDYFYVTTANRVDHAWHLNVSPYIMTNAPLVDAEGWFCIDALRTGSVVSGRAGTAVGIAFDKHLWVAADGRSSFLGPAILADEIVDPEKLYPDLRRRVAESVLRVELSLRPEGPEELAIRRAGGMGGPMALFGAVLDAKGTLLIPGNAPREVIRRVEEIRVVYRGRKLPATFIGSFREFGAMLVRVKGLDARPGVVLDAPEPPPGRLFYTAAFEDRFGRHRIRMGANRMFRTEAGLNGAARRQPRSRIPLGAFLLDPDGGIIGFSTVDNKEEDLEEMALQGARQRYYMAQRRLSYTPDYLRRLIFLSGIAGELADPAAHFDPKSVPVTKSEEKKLVWLGVQFQPLNKPVAEILGIQDRHLSNDGRRGLIVTAVYPGSPADRAGIQVEDILLSIRTKEGDGARDLAPDPRTLMGMRRRFGYGNPNPRPWASRRNYLTSLLTEMGAGTEVVFETLRLKEKREVALTLKEAPSDYDSADRFKDDNLGLSVRELTYEVRHHQKLTPDVTGVVVSKVESGSPAGVAKLPALSVISRINDVPVRDLDHFRRLLSGKGPLTLTTLFNGQTKLIELARP